MARPSISFGVGGVMGGVKEAMETEAGQQEDTVGKRWPWSGLPAHVRLLCIGLLAISVLQSITPIEAFLHEYMVKGKSVDGSVISNEVWPVFSYALTFSLIPLAYMSEYITGYAAAVSLGIVLRLSMTLLQEFGPSGQLWPHQAAMLLFGIASACKVSFDLLVYSVVPESIFYSITGYMRAGNLVAHVFGGALGYLLMTQGAAWPIYFGFTQACTTIAFGILVSVLFVTKGQPRNSADEAGRQLAPRISSIRQFRELLNVIYGTRELALWSIWFIATFAIYELLLINYSSLFYTIDPLHNKLNGVVFGVGRLSSATAALLITRHPSFVIRHGIHIMLLGSSAAAALIFISGQTSHIWIAYGALVALFTVLEACFCSANAIIASGTQMSSRGVAFFLKMLLSRVFESILQCACTGFLLDVRTKFVVFALVMAAISILLYVTNAIYPRCATKTAAPVDDDLES